MTKIEINVSLDYIWRQIFWPHEVQQNPTQKLFFNSLNYPINVPYIFPTDKPKMGRTTALLTLALWSAIRGESVLYLTDEKATAARWLWLMGRVRHSINAIMSQHEEWTPSFANELVRQRLSLLRYYRMADKAAYSTRDCKVLLFDTRITEEEYSLWSSTVLNTSGPHIVVCGYSLQDAKIYARLRDRAVYKPSSH
jgi:hypothetical protein